MSAESEKLRPSYTVSLVRLSGHEEGTYGTDSDVKSDEWHCDLVQYLLSRQVPEIITLSQEARDVDTSM